MKLSRIAPLAVFVLLAAAAHAQIGSSISIRGTMSIQEGGNAAAQGFVESTEKGILGSFGISFDRGPLTSLRMARFTGFSAPGDTAFFEGPAQAVMIENGRKVLVRGHCIVMVDDLHERPSFPDQFFMHFTTRDNRIIVRHGRMTSGDIVVVHP